MATLTHFCDRCMQQIEPGDRYGRFVEIRRGKIVVYKYHDVPDCPPDPLEEERLDQSESIPEVRLAA